jgi:hypothetical protein
MLLLARDRFVVTMSRSGMSPDESVSPSPTGDGRSPTPEDDPTNDPDMGSGLLEREIGRLEREIASLKTKLHRAHDTIAELEKEREDRYTKIKVF